MFGPNSESVTTTRDVIAVLVPQGDKVHVPADTECYITQALGGSYTIYIQGRLLRVDGADADALGKEPVTGPELPNNASDEDVEKLVWEQLRTVYDPEIPVDIAELGLVYDCKINKIDEDNRSVDITMTLTAPGCGMGDILVADVKAKVEKIPTVTQSNVELVFDPPWTQDMMSEAARLQLGMI
ncbi:putative Fe-S cluster assembly protein SufT [Litorivivens sp.]|uniref:putative Fe-S cluster assembly protein SufT n=1 Tax=Litorivivens sp. TaxID=2020868 RepID=UPI003565A04A